MITWPPTRIVADRVAPGLAATWNVTDAATLPEIGPAKEIHSAVEAMVHGQPISAPIARLPAPPPAPNDVGVELAVTVQVGGEAPS